MVTIPTDLPTNADLTIQAISCEGFDDAAITINEIIGGTTPYSIQVNNTSISVGAPINNLAAGNYQLSVLDACLLYTSPSPRDATLSRMPSSA